MMAVNRDLRLTPRIVADEVDASVAQERLIATLAGFFGALALLLAALGLYGVTAHAVGRRRHEIGIRIGLGAKPADVVRLVLRRVFWLVCVGILLGAGASLWLSRFVAPLLFGLQPRDPFTLAAAALTLATVGALAGWLPAARGTDRSRGSAATGVALTVRRFDSLGGCSPPSPCVSPFVRSSVPARFPLAVIVTLAIVFSINVTAFGLLWHAWLRPLPYHQADRLVALFSTDAAGGSRPVSLPDLLDIERGSRSVPVVAGYLGRTANGARPRQARRRRSSPSPTPRAACSTCCA